MHPATADQSTTSSPIVAGAKPDVSSVSSPARPRVDGEGVECAFGVADVDGGGEAGQRRRTRHDHAAGERHRVAPVGAGDRHPVHAGADALPHRDIPGTR
jgi:hypothetical protein